MSSFFVQATEEIHAIDCSDQVSSKKGRYPQLVGEISQILMPST